MRLTKLQLGAGLGTPATSRASALKTNAIASVGTSSPAEPSASRPITETSPSLQRTCSAPSRCSSSHTSSKVAPWQRLSSTIGVLTPGSRIALSALKLSRRGLVTPRS